MESQRRRAHVHARVPGVALALVRIALAFSLAFGATLNAQLVWAADGSSSSAAAPAASGSSSSAASDGPSLSASGGSSSSSSAASLSIADIGVFEEGTTRNALAYASEGASSASEVRAVIERKGGQIDFDAAILWNDGSDWEYDSSKVSWRIDAAGASIARISPSGILEAAGVGDGIVEVTALVDGSYTADGRELAARFSVELRGQTDAKYVVGITICDEAGASIDSLYRFEAGTLATAMLELTARVRVFDPAVESEVEYLVTPTSGLASQSGGELADLVWECADSRLGSVSEEGIYRPLVAATNIVYAASTAGFNGTRVTASAVIDMPPAEGKEAANGYHPQETLTVKVYYEDYPDKLVAEKLFTLDDLEALGTAVVTYTAMRGKEGFMTTTGRGPLLAKVLKAAGVNTAGVARLRFGTPDNYQGVVSWDLLVDQARYYFPNIDIGSRAEKVPVAPMIAIDSYRNVGSDVSAHPEDMTDTRRFLLLFGAKDTGETTTNLQVYNIHTLYVELEGSPPAKSGNVNVRFIDSVTGEVLKSASAANPEGVSAPDPPTHDGYVFNRWDRSVDEGGNVTYTAMYERDDADDAADPENPAGGPGDGADGVPGADGPGAVVGAPGDKQGEGRFDLVDTPSPAGGNAGGGQSAPAPSSSTVAVPLSADDVKVVNPGRWSMLQAINRHPSNVADLMLENPLAPYAAPAFAGLLAAGALETGLAYRRQKRRCRE